MRASGFGYYAWTLHFLHLRGFASVHSSHGRVLCFHTVLFAHTTEDSCLLVVVRFAASTYRLCFEISLIIFSALFRSGIRLMWPQCALG